ncbi:Insulin-degrading enzyme (Insulin protease) (Insulinase) (Insulysin) [Durusdinium trenchii]|uniref:Insulin-degrading enzyme (Insulin protease) (Insulinase) (Insulysin) n=1 Tax=Durusdinium trenchii TaxID=1381693 RepID=A0ABP0R8E2_9DINO
MTTPKNLCPSLDAAKSPNDRNSYRLIELSNGIQALLVSNLDPKKQKAACACCVQVGSFSDPSFCEGLAHYCEHMIFLGSKKYPGEAQFEEFLSENGGESNAYTECEYTSFYFSVNCKALHGALDMFAQLFHEPLFTPDASYRELQAIESEFQKKKRSDSIRAETLFASFASRGHPWRLFGWGNLQSLDEEPKKQGVDLHSELQTFFAKNYKACRMRLCVFGIESLDSLETAVSQSFSCVESFAGTTQLDFAQCGMPLRKEDLPSLVRVRPIRDGHSLWMSWQLPPQLRYYHSKPESYLSSLIGDEGPGSILSYLKNEGWASELTAGAGGDNFSHSSNSMIFNVQIDLTDKGLSHWTEVVKTVFQYLEMLRRFQSLPAYLYEEIKQIAQMSFQFMQEKDPSDLVIDLSERMLPLYHHQPEHLLTAPWTYTGFREDLIRPLLDGLTVRGCFFMLMSSSYGRAGGLDKVSESEASSTSGQSELEAQGNNIVQEKPEQECLDSLFDGQREALVEPRFGTEYWVSSLDEMLLLPWESAEPPPELHVPPPNKFIATDFTLLRDDVEEEELPDLPPSAIEGFPLISARLSPTPRHRNSETPGLRLWHLPCAQRFGQPRSLLSLKITSADYVFDPSNVRKEVLLELLSACLQDSLNEIFYTASKAKLNCSFNDTIYGLKLRAGGFSQKLLALVETMIQGLWLKSYAQDRFHSQWEEKLRCYRNAWLKPQVHCASLRKLLLLLTTSRPSQKEAELSTCTLQECYNFMGDFYASVACELLMSGNTSQDELDSWISSSLATQLPMKNCCAPDCDVVQLSPRTAAVWLEAGIDSTQSNSALEVYFQLPGRDSWTWKQDRAHMKVLLNLLEDMMYENLFDELRTKQQLGYSVGCSTRDTFGVHGFSIYVLSAVQRPPNLLKAVETFLQDFARQLRDWPLDKFNSHMVGLGGRMLEPKRTLAEIHEACWSEITFGHPEFARTERDAAMLGAIQPSELIDLFERYIAPGGDGRACIVTAVVPKADEGELEALCQALTPGGLEVTTVSDEQSFRSRSKLHPRRA